MLVPLVILFLASTHGSIIQSVSVSENRSDVRIIGGDIATDGLAPYQVSLQFDRGHNCGGSILNDRWILTAGHCIDTSKTMTVVAGTNKQNAGGVRYAVEEQIVHSELYMHGVQVINDIALLKLAEKIEFTDKIQPIDLPTEDTEAGADLMVTGWGMMTRIPSSGTPQPVAANDLQVIFQKALSNNECWTWWRDIYLLPMHLCAYNNPNNGICGGDSGGPLVEGNTVVGVASFVRSPCAAGYPDVYSRVYWHLNWIHETMQAYE